MAIDSMDDLIAALPGQSVGFLKMSQASQTAGRYISLWQVPGRPWTSTTAPTGAGETCTNAKTGALPLTNAAGGNQLYLAQASGGVTQTGTLILYDRLVHTSGLVGNVNTLQAVNSVALPSRATGGEGVGIWLEGISNLGVTAVTATVSYTNQAGTSGRTGTAAVPATFRQYQMIPVQLAAGDTGVRSVESVTLSATTGTAGNFGVVLLKRITEVPILANHGFAQDAFDLGLPELPNDACLALIVLMGATSSPQIVGSYSIVEG